MEPEELRRNLVQTARNLGCEEPEDVAHDVILSALRSDKLGLDSPAYWLVAVRNRRRDELRRYRPIIGLLDVSAPAWEEPHETRNSPDISKEPEYPWLIEYYRNWGILSPPKIRIKAMRLRNQLRKRLKEESNGKRRTR